MSINCITGYNDYLHEHLKKSILDASSIDIIVSFLMESGVKLIKNELEIIRNKKIPIRILTGNYLNITQPSALYLLKDILGNEVDLRFYNDNSRSFHPKAYIFENKNGGEIFIGSSNLSKSALTEGIEWNYRIDKEKDKDSFMYFKETFENLFLNHSTIVNDEELKRYSNNWKKSRINVNNNNNINIYDNKGVFSLYEPRGAQIEALYELKRTRKLGYDKGIVVASTGIGKTYLSAFDSKDFNRVLFVAHREEILKQAYESFKNVRNDKYKKNNLSLVAENFNDKFYKTTSYNNEGYNMGFFMNSIKDTDKDIIFASVQSLGKEKYLEYFEKDYFDYIIIDEFHHAVSKNYQNIINYFKAKFLLGLTATPERLDNKDVFSICDYNVVYEIYLKEAIEKDLLVPFRYYGIYDETINYDEIKFSNGKYDTKYLEDALIINQRADLIFNNYKKYNSKKALGFCTSKKHADFMANYFNEKGIKSVSVYSGNKEGEYKEERSIAIKKLINEEIKIIFSVDMFNEGVDIKSIDMVMFLRPTESPIIFLQQLGRGLRKDKDKNYLNVLDFIGNYKNANLAPYLLTETKENNKTIKELLKDENIPDDCLINFDFRLIDLFEKIENKKLKTEELIKKEYFRIKNDLGHIPSRLEFFTYMDNNLYFNTKKSSKLNIFKDYMSFLDSIDELERTDIVDSIAHDFIKFIENTSMSKTYKLPIFLAFFNNYEMKSSITNFDLYISFKNFYSKGSNKVDLLNQKSTENFENWKEKEFINLARKNPIKFLCNKDSFFSEDKDFVYLDKSLEKYFDDKFFLDNVIDAINFRTKEYYKNRFRKE